MGKHFLIPYFFYSRPNERFSPDLTNVGIGFNNTYNIDQNNSISYSSSLATTNYNKKKASRFRSADQSNNDIFSTSVGYNYTFADLNQISSKISYVEKHAKADFNAYTGEGINFGYTRILPLGNFTINKTFQTNNYEKRNEKIHSTINRVDDIETTRIQLSGRMTQLFPFIKKLDPESKIFYNLNHTQIDSVSSILQNTSMRKNTSFSIIKRFSLYE